MNKDIVVEISYAFSNYGLNNEIMINIITQYQSCIHNCQSVHYV